MTWEIVVGLTTLSGALIAVMNVVVRVNRTLTSLESAVKRLDEAVREQSAKNRTFYEQLGSHELRLSMLEKVRLHRDTARIARSPRSRA